MIQRMNRYVTKEIKETLEHNIDNRLQSYTDQGKSETLGPSTSSVQDQHS